MLDLKKIKAPSSVMVEGVFYKIKTDYQYWLMFAELLQNKPLLGEFDFLYNDVVEGVKAGEKKRFLFWTKTIKESEYYIKPKIPEDRQAGFNELLKFYAPERELPRRVGAGTSEKLLDYTLDADLIYSAFMEQYRIDLLDENLHLHWWKFLALLEGLHDTKYNEIIGYRAFEPEKNSDYKKDMTELKQAWSLPTVLSEEEQKALDKFDSMFK